MSIKETILLLLTMCTINIYSMVEQYSDLQEDGYTRSADNKIIKACATGNIAAIQNFLLNRGVDIDRALDASAYILDQRSVTPLLIAVEHNQFELAKFLIDQGANLEATDCKGDTALMWALRKHHIKLIELLMSRKANIEASNDLGMTILHRCIDENLAHCLELVILLVNHGANPNSQEPINLFTPLMLAALNGNLPVVEFLLSCRVPIDRISRNGNTALMLATKEGHRDTVKLLMSGGAQTSITNVHGSTALRIAQFKEHRDLISLLSPADEKIAAEDTEIPAGGEEPSHSFLDWLLYS